MAAITRTSIRCGPSAPSGPLPIELDLALAEARSNDHLPVATQKQPDEHLAFMELRRLCADTAPEGTGSAR